MILKGVIIALLAVVSVFLFVSCAVNKGEGASSTVTRAAEEILFTDGEVTMLALNSVTIRTENGMEYCFAMDEGTELPDTEIAVGDSVSIGYHSSADKAQIALSVLLI